MNEDELRLRIRGELAEDRLIPAPDLVLRVRMGTGSRCSACGAAITGELVQVTYRALDGADFRLHERCEMVWKSERQRQRGA